MCRLVGTQRPPVQESEDPRPRVGRQGEGGGSASVTCQSPEPHPLDRVRLESCWTDSVAPCVSGGLVWGSSFGV